VTWGDCRRIFAHTHRKDFFEYRVCADTAYADQGDDPVWQQHVFRADGSRRVLLQQPNGDCLFLNATGCQLPLAVRPLICRLFPHLYSVAGLIGQWDPGCLAAQKDANAPIVHGIAGVGGTEAPRWHRMLYDEIIWEGLADENWADL
jgi:Fe-S-cluster containining protein